MLFIWSAGMVFNTSDKFDEVAPEGFPGRPADGQHLSHVRAPVVSGDREPRYAKDVEHFDRVEGQYGGVARARMPSTLCPT